jgi:diacylglycerol kinase (ATP)
LPHLQGVVILNIESYMGGVNFWGFPRGEQFVEQSFSDGLLEVGVLLVYEAVGLRGC